MQVLCRFTEGLKPLQSWVPRGPGTDPEGPRMTVHLESALPDFPCGPIHLLFASLLPIPRLDDISVSAVNNIYIITVW